MTRRDTVAKYGFANLTEEQAEIAHIFISLGKARMMLLLGKCGVSEAAGQRLKAAIEDVLDELRAASTPRNRL